MRPAMCRFRKKRRKEMYSPMQKPCQTALTAKVSSWAWERASYDRSQTHFRSHSCTWQFQLLILSRGVTESMRGAALTDCMPEKASLSSPLPSQLSPAASMATVQSLKPRMYLATTRFMATKEQRQMQAGEKVRNSGSYMQLKGMQRIYTAKNAPAIRVTPRLEAAASRDGVRGMLLNCFSWWMQWWKRAQSMGVLTMQVGRKLQQLMYSSREGIWLTLSSTRCLYLVLWMAGSAPSWQAYPSRECLQTPHITSVHMSIRQLLQSYTILQTWYSTPMVPATAVTLQPDPERCPHRRGTYTTRLMATDISIYGPQTQYCRAREAARLNQVRRKGEGKYLRKRLRGTQMRRPLTKRIWSSLNIGRWLQTIQTVRWVTNVGYFNAINKQ